MKTPTLIDVLKRATPEDPASIRRLIQRLARAGLLDARFAIDAVLAEARAIIEPIVQAHGGMLQVDGGLTVDFSEGGEAGCSGFVRCDLMTIDDDAKELWVDIGCAGDRQRWLELITSVGWQVVKRSAPLREVDAAAHRRWQNEGARTQPLLNRLHLAQVQVNAGAPLREVDAELDLGLLDFGEDWFDRAVSGQRRDGFYIRRTGAAEWLPLGSSPPVQQADPGRINARPPRVIGGGDAPIIVAHLPIIVAHLLVDGVQLPLDEAQLAAIMSGGVVDVTNQVRASLAPDGRLHIHHIDRGDFMSHKEVEPDYVDDYLTLLSAADDLTMGTPRSAVDEELAAGPPGRRGQPSPSHDTAAHPRAVDRAEGQRAARHDGRVHRP